MFVAVVVLTLVGTVATAHAQGSRTQSVNIPFNFNVGDENLPAGDYKVTRLMNGGEAIAISGSESAIRLTSLIVKNEPARRSKLVFHRYGDTYFLSELWTAGDANGRRLVKSKTEGRLQREATKVARSQSYDLYEVAIVR